MDSAIEEIHSEIDNGWADETGTIHPYDAPKLKEAVSIVLDTYNLSYGNEGRLSEFQFRSIVQTLRGIYAGGFKTLAIVGGTGSGKSYGFQLGAVIAIVEQRLAGTLTSVHSLFLYPRVALMADQREALEKLLNLINTIHLGGIEIRWASDGGSFLKTIDYRRLVNPDIEPDKLERKGIREIIRSIYADPNKCPHLVFANPDTLTNRLGDPVANHFLTNGLKNLVVDEIHLLESITGANSAGVIRRLCSLTTSEMMLTGSSATVAEEKEHLSKVFGRPPERIVTVIPDPDTEMELTGIIHHVLHRGVEGQNYISNLTNLTSLVGHIRRRRIEEVPERIEDSHKTLGFADSLQLLGSWEYQVRDNEGLELTKTMRNRMWNNRPAAELLPKKEPLAFRFNRPLVQLAKVESNGLLDEAECVKHCSNCIAGIQSTLEVEDASILKNIRLDHFRKDNFREIEGFDIEEGPTQIGITDGCPYFRAGACWREEQSYEPVQIYPTGPTVYSSSLHPIRLTAATIQEKKNQELKLFEIDLGRYHNIPQVVRNNLVDDEKIADLALSSPAIEVGMDFDNALEAVLFKAIRNVSAYRQKVGRLGRERYRDVYGSMLTSFRAVDYHYYRNPSPLLSNDRLEPIPLSVDNEKVRSQTAFLAVFDDITKYSEDFASRDICALHANDCYLDVVNGAINHLNNVEEIARRIREGLGERDLDICRKSVMQARVQLKLLVEDISPMLTNGASCLADRIGSPKGIKGPMTRNSRRLHQLHLSNSGDLYKEVCEKLRDTVSIFAVNQHCVTEDGSRIEELFDNAILIWSDIEKGLDSDRVENFINMIEDQSILMECLTSAMNDPRIMQCIQSATDFFSSFGDCNDEVSSMVRNGKISLGISFGNWNSLATARDYQCYYLRDLLGNLHMTQHRLPHVFQKALFESPNAAKTNLFVPQRRYWQDDDDEREATKEVDIKEVIFAHAPGMWSYRQGDSPMKTKCYQSLLATPVPSVMHLPFHDPSGSEQTAIKHKFIRRGTVPSNQMPWTYSISGSSNGVTLYRPEQLNLMKSKGPDRGNKIALSMEFPVAVAADGDDISEDNSNTGSDEEDPTGRMPVNIPDCIALQWRSIEGHLPTPIKSFSGPVEGVEFESDALANLLFSEIDFDADITAKEFTLGHLRKYQGGDELCIQYISDRNSLSPAAMGYEFQSHGISFQIRKEILSSASDWSHRMLSSKSGHPVRYQILQHILRKMLKSSRFTADSLLRMALYTNEYEVPANIVEWMDLIRSLDKLKLVPFAEAWEDASRVRTSVTDLESLLEKIEADPRLLNQEQVPALVEDWTVRTLANSLGIHLVQAGSEFTGSRDEDLGYHITLGDGDLATTNSEVKVWLYDRSPDGNGTVETISNWFYIPDIVREVIERPNINRRNLPSRDFIQTLADYIQPCDGNQANVVAYACGEIGKDPSEIQHRLGRDILFDHANYSEEWEKIRNDHGFHRSTHVFMNLVYPLLESDDIHRERMKKASSGCHTSCVECLEEFGISMLGPLDGPLYACKRMIDAVLQEAMSVRSEDFRLNELTAEGASQGLEGIGQYDSENPLSVNIDGNVVQVYSMMHPERMWTEINTDKPLSDDGELNVRSWTKMSQSRWS
jgi:hypothetical protein